MDAQTKAVAIFGEELTTSLRDASQLGDDAPQIRRVYLRNCSIHSIVWLRWLFALRRVVLVDLSNNFLPDIGPTTLWTACLSLKYLFLDNNRLEDVDHTIRALADVTSLIVLSTRGNGAFTGARQRIIRGMPHLLVLDDHIVTDVERLSTWVPPMATHRFQPLSPTTFLGDRMLATDVFEYDAKMLSTLSHVVAHASPSTIIQRVWKGHIVRTRVLPATQQREKGRRRRSALFERQPQDGKPMSGAVQMLRNAADALLVIKRAASKWTAKRQMLVKELQERGVCEFVIRAVDIAFWTRTLRSVFSGTATADTVDPSLLTLESLDGYVVLKPHNHAASSEARSHPFPSLVYSTVVIAAVRPVKGPIRDSLRPLQRRAVLSRYCRATLAPRSHGEYVTAAVTTEKSLCRGKKNRGLVRVTVRGPFYLGGAINNVMVYNAMRKGTQNPVSFYFMQDVVRVAASVRIQSWVRGHWIRKQLLHYNLHVDRGCGLFFPALCFYVTFIQSQWRQTLARRRAAFLRSLRDAVTLVLCRAEGTSTIGFITSSTIEQMLSAPSETPFCSEPEHDAFLKGIRLSSDDVGRSCVSACSTSYTAQRANSIVVRGKENFARIPVYLRAHLAPDASASDCRPPTLMEILLLSAEIKYFSYPTTAAKERHVRWVPNSQRSVSPSKPAPPTAKWKWGESLSAKLLSTRAEVEETEEVQTVTRQLFPNAVEWLRALVQRFPNGHLCIAYCDRLEAIRRRIALMALSYSLRDASSLCFEPQRRIVDEAASAMTLQRWWKRVMRRRAVPPTHHSTPHDENTSFSVIPTRSDQPPSVSIDAASVLIASARKTQTAIAPLLLSSQTFSSFAPRGALEHALEPTAATNSDNAELMISRIPLRIACALPPATIASAVNKHQAELLRKSRECNAAQLATRTPSTVQPESSPKPKVPLRVCCVHFDGTTHPPAFTGMVEGHLKSSKWVCCRQYSRADLAMSHEPLIDTESSASAPIQPRPPPNRPVVNFAALRTVYRQQANALEDQIFVAQREAVQAGLKRNDMEEKRRIEEARERADNDRQAKELSRRRRLIAKNCHRAAAALERRLRKEVLQERTLKQRHDAVTKVEQQKEVLADTVGGHREVDCREPASGSTASAAVAMKPVPPPSVVRL